MLVVVPAHNEAGSIADVVARIQAVDLACLVVDDGSTDGTGAIARAAGAQAVCLPINLGVGGALRTGFRYAVAHGFEVVPLLGLSLRQDLGMAIFVVHIPDAIGKAI